MTIDMRHARIVYYGCVRCQREHRQGQPEFEAHIFDQSKHGIRERPDPDRFVPEGDPNAYYAPLPRG